MQICGNIALVLLILGRHSESYLSPSHSKQDDNGFLIKFKLGIKDGKLKLPNGLVTPNNLRLTLQDLINERSNVDDFDILPIPFRVVATDLVDGGVTNNVPVDIVRAMGVDIVIVVDISTPMLGKDEIESFTNVIDQLVLIMTRKNADAQLATLTDQDILIRPELEDIGFADFKKSLEAIPRGAASGQMLDEVSMSRDMSEIYGLELFEEVSYRIIEDDQQTGVEVLARRSESGHRNFRFGLAIQDDLDGESGYRISVAYTNLAVNKLGGEVEARVAIGDEQGVFASFYQPIDATQRTYLLTQWIMSSSLTEECC